jgi:hypothetical protein
MKNFKPILIFCSLLFFATQLQAGVSENYCINSVRDTFCQRLLEGADALCAYRQYSLGYCTN